MSNRLFRLGVSSLVAAGLLLAASAAHAQGAPPGAGGADYQAKLAQYQAAHGAYEAEASVYWEAVAEKRRTRNAKRRDRLPNRPTLRLRRLRARPGIARAWPDNRRPPPRAARLGRAQPTPPMADLAPLFRIRPNGRDDCLMSGCFRPFSSISTTFRKNNAPQMRRVRRKIFLGQCVFMARSGRQSPISRPGPPALMTVGFCAVVRRPCRD